MTPRMRFVLLVFLAACTKQASQEAASPPAITTGDQVKIELVNKGKTSYQSNCTACHNPDPKKDGPLGPAIFGSSYELIEARVMRAEYPADYKPKRASKVMVALPQVKADLDALAAFLNKN